MNWGRYALVVVLASVLASFSDWLFMGIFFHDKYTAAREIWRVSTVDKERSLVIFSQLIGVVSCAAITYLCTQGLSLTVPGILRITVIAWAGGPVVVLAQMVLWTKLHPLIGLSHSVGWLVRFILTGLLAAWLL